MGTVLDLDAPFDSPAEDEPACEFTLGGRQWTCLPKDDIPTFAIFAATVQTSAFFDAVLVPDQRAPFTEMLLGRGDAQVTLRQVHRAVRLVSEEISGFPTKPPAPSPTTTAPTRRKSAASSSPRATRARRSN